MSILPIRAPRFAVYNHFLQIPKAEFNHFTKRLCYNRANKEFNNSTVALKPKADSKTCVTGANCVNQSPNRKHFYSEFTAVFENKILPVVKLVLLLTKYQLGCPQKP